MVGWYGNKGVILVIMLVEDMFYDMNGELVDVVLNLLGVFLWMNVGQIFEVYLGMVVYGFGKCIEKMFQVKQEVVEFWEFLVKVYNQIGEKIEQFDLFNDEEIFELVKNLLCGVFMVMSVFDGV